MDQETQSKKKSYIVEKTTLTFVILLTLMSGYLIAENRRLTGKLKIIFELEGKTQQAVEKRVDSYLEKLSSNLEPLVLQRAAEESIKDNLTKITSNVEKVAQGIMSKSRDKSLRDKKNAERSYEKSKFLALEGSLELARVYLINAINHDPTEFKYIAFLMDLFNKHYKKIILY